MRLITVTVQTVWQDHTAIDADDVRQMIVRGLFDGLEAEIVRFRDEKTVDVTFADPSYEGDDYEVWQERGHEELDRNLTKGA